VGGGCVMIGNRSRDRIKFSSVWKCNYLTNTSLFFMPETIPDAPVKEPKTVPEPETPRPETRPSPDPFEPKWPETRPEPQPKA